MDAYCGHELTHQRLEAHREIFSRATAAARWSWRSVGGEAGLCGGHSVVAAFGCTLARHAGAVSQRRDLLAAFAALAGEVWEKAWRQLLRQLEQRGHLDWDPMRLRLRRRG